MGRGEIVLHLLFTIFMLILLKNFIPNTKIKILKIFSFVMSIPLIVFFWIISVSRFGKLASLFVVKYLGESFIAFNGILYPNLHATTNGQAYFPVFYGLFDVNYKVFLSAHEKWDFLENITRFHVLSFILLWERYI